MPIVTIDLRSEAAAEVVRLTRARALTAGNDDPVRPDGGRAWIVPARSRTLRQTLGRRALLIWRLSSEDANGRPVESRIVGAFVDLDHQDVPCRTRASARALVTWAGRTAAPLIDGCSAGWRNAVVPVARAFAVTRAARERAIVRHAPEDDRVFQPGLFDRRAEHRRQLRAEAIADADRLAAERLSATDPTHVIFGQPQLRLVVLP